MQGTTRTSPTDPLLARARGRVAARAGRTFARLALAGLAGAWLAGAAPPPRQDDLGRAVQDLLRARCAECHAPDSDNPKARKHLDDVRDLAHVIDEIVLPGDLDFSELWEVVADGTMPPEDDGGPLSEIERGVIRAWILAGAPLPEVTGAAAPAPAPVPDPSVATTPAEPATGLRFLGWLGRLHPALVHFPIALLLAAALAELLRMLGGAPWLASAARFCIQIGCAGALVAGATGWFSTEYGTQAGRDIGWHRWLACATIALSIVLLALSELAHRRAGAGPSKRYRLVLFATVVLVGVTGHFGGMLVHGSDYLAW